MTKLEIDLIDRKLLYELDQNARQGFSAIAKRLRISRNVAAYRFNQLKKTGIIKQSFAEINNIALGYNTFRVFLKLSNYTPKQYADFDMFLMKNSKHLTWYSRVLGKWDIDIAFTCSDMQSFAQFRSELFYQHNAIIESFSISILRDIYCYPKDFLIQKERKNVETKHFTKTTYNADKKDRELLQLLTKDAMMPTLELAKATKLSINTVKKKLQLLEDNNIILRYRLYLDTNKLGYQYYKLHIVFRNYTKKDINAFRSFLESKSYVPYTDHYLDAEDFEIELQLPDETQYIAFLQELKHTFGYMIKDYFLVKFYDEKIFRYLPLQD